ncbi:MAG: TetR/AcrR family transcriptional regulator, partial [Nakamurella sp.]
AGLRESKKSGTRAALIECALDLEQERGYHGFTISELVDRAGVSRRTFSNYFAGKAECLAAVGDGWMEAALQLVDARSPAVALPDLLREVLENFAEQIASRPTSFFAIRGSEPELVAATNAADTVHAERIATVISQRTGVDVNDVRVPLLASFCLAAGRSCIGRWVAQNRAGGQAGLAKELDSAFSLIDFSRLQVRWNTPASGPAHCAGTL